MGTHYIDYEPKSASNNRKGVLRIAAVASSIALASGYVVYRVRAATPPLASVRMMSRVATIPLTRGAATLTVSSTQPAQPRAIPVPKPLEVRPGAALSAGDQSVFNPTQQQLLLMSSSKSGSIIPPPSQQQPLKLTAGADDTAIFLMPGGPALSTQPTTAPATQP